MIKSPLPKEKINKITHEGRISWDEGEGLSTACNWNPCLLGRQDSVL